MNEATYDVLVMGTGAAGMACAITAQRLGLRVLVVEKAAAIGGTTALSGGWLWIPCSAHARRAGVVDSLYAVRAYLRAELVDRYDPGLVEAYLATGPRMLDFFEQNTPLRFFVGLDYPDYHSAQPGATAGGRSVCALPVDGRLLGRELATLRKPVPEMTLFGLRVGSGADFQHFFKARRSLRSAFYVLRRIVRHGLDHLLHGRDLTLMSGNALVGALACSLRDLQIPVWRGSEVTQLLQEDGVVRGAVVRREGETVTVRVQRGVVCATGGFGHDKARRQDLLPSAAADDAHSLTVPEATGDGIRLAQAAGGHVPREVASAAAWMPVSAVRRRDGTRGLYPHSFERGKPGVIAIDSTGARFANESDSYHDFVRALLAREPVTGRCWFVADATFVARYGLGIAKPFPLPLKRFLASGYLRRAPTLAALAALIGVDAPRLAHTVESFNREARHGVDSAFGRGASAYNRYQGDRQNTPNPCLAPIVTAPFYAVEVSAGDLATFAGLAADRDGRALDAAGAPIPGLYAVGTDMASPFKGVYVGAGANLGPAMVFGYRAAHHLAGIDPVAP